MKALVAVLSEDLDYLLESSGKAFNKSKGMVDMDAIREPPFTAMQSAVHMVASMFGSHGKRKVFVKDDQGRFTLENAKRYLWGDTMSQIIREAVTGHISEEAGYAAEAEDWKLEKALMRKAKTFSKRSFKVEPVTSPRTGSKGFRITY